MNKSQRIKATLDGSDKYIQVKLEQNVDFLEILSLKIDQQQAYQNFNSDYGVLVGRVIANDGIGVPNVKISIFIPLSDEDELNPKIKAIYPYKSPQDKNVDGKRYNLLPRVATKSADGTYKPVQPFGSFPPKEEILTNETYLEVYEKYYRYTTVTNNSGDYMLFGVPVGIQTVHMSVDITDIGQFSMTPASMISQLGYSPNLFINNSIIKPSNDLSDLPNIETQEISVEIRPFWGDTENYEIGITRQDFRIRAVLVSTFTIFGHAFTDAYYAAWGWSGELNRMQANQDPNIEFTNTADRYRYNLDIESKRQGRFDISVFYYPNTVTDDKINSGDIDTMRDILLLDKSQYSEILDDGLFILNIPCNRRKKILNEFGELVDTTDDNPNGIFTEFKGFITIKYGEDLDNYEKRSSNDGNRIDIVRIKIPQSSPIIGNDSPLVAPTYERGVTISNPNGTSNSRLRNEIWRKQYYTFKFGKIYSITKFHGTVYGTGSGNITHPDGSNIDILSNRAYGIVNNKTANPARNSGCIIVGSSTGETYGMVTNATNVPINYSNINANASDPKVNVFAAEWLNLGMYLPQFKITTAGITDISDNVTPYKNNVSGMVRSNTQLVAGGVFDTSMFLRSDFHPTSFIEVPREDLVKMANTPNRGFTTNDFTDNPLIGNYSGTTSIKYFFKGIGERDSIQFLIDNGIISV